MPANALRTPLAAALSAVVLAACGTETAPVAEDPTTSEPSGPSSSPAAPSDTAESSPVAEVDSVTVPVYFVGDAPQGPRLFREFRRVPAQDPAAAALELLGSGDALDPDYRTLLPAAQGLSASLEGAGEDATIALALPADSPWLSRGDLPEAEARLAVQSVVYTLQGVFQAKAPLSVTHQGTSHAADLLGVPTGNGYSRAPELDVLGLASVTTPEEGATVADTFEASGVASSFEATVPIEVRDASGAVVVETFATAEGWMDRLHPWTTTVDVSALAPGVYTFVARTDDPSGGAEGFGPTEDTKTITIQ